MHVCARECVHVNTIVTGFNREVQGNRKEFPRKQCSGMADRKRSYTPYEILIN